MKDMERTRLDAIRRRLSYGAGTVLAVSFCLEHLEFDQAYEDAIAKAMSTTDPAEADAYFHEAEDLFCNDYVLLPLYFGSARMMMKDYIINWNETATGAYVFDQIEVLPH